MIKIILLWLLITFSFTPVFSQTQAELNKTACDNYKRADADLNRVYQQIFREYKADTLFLEKLKVAQRAWLSYRDAQIEALYPAPDPQLAYGSVHPMCRCEALKELTLRRRGELARWVKGVQEGEVCAGSIRMRETTGRFRRRVNPNKR